MQSNKNAPIWSVLFLALKIDIFIQKKEEYICFFDIFVFFCVQIFDNL